MDTETKSAVERLQAMAAGIETRLFVTTLHTVYPKAMFEEACADYAADLRLAIDALSSAPPPSGEETTWRPISEIETRWAGRTLYAIVCIGEAVGEAEFYGEDAGWWWANTYGEYRSERIYPTLFQPLPTPSVEALAVWYEGSGE